MAEGDTLPSLPCHLEPRTRTLCRREDNFAASNCSGGSLTLHLGRRGTVNLAVNAGNTSSVRASGVTARRTRRYSRATQPLCRDTERGTEGATRHSRGNEQDQTEGTARRGLAGSGRRRLVVALKEGVAECEFTRKPEDLEPIRRYPRVPKDTVGDVGR